MPGKQFVLPVQYLILDGLGTILAGLGLYELFVDDASIIPVSMQFENDAHVILAAGIVMMVIGITGIIKALLARQKVNGRRSD